MITENYSPTLLKRLSRLAIPALKEPIELKILWLRALSCEAGASKVSKKRHKHSFFEAHFVLFGEAEYEHRGEIYKLNKNSAILFPPECEHTVKGMSNDVFKLSVAFSTESKIFDHSGVTFSRSRSAASAQGAIISALDEKKPFYEYVIRDCVFAMLTELMNEDTTSSAELRAPTCDPRVIAAKKYVEDNLALFLTCEDVARYCHFNVKYLNRLFKEETGKTLLYYIHDVKTHGAEKLLSETDLPLSEIANALGFENEYYFNAFFKRRSGIAPGLYRKLRKK